MESKPENISHQNQSSFLNHKKKKSGGFQSMGLTPPVFRAIMAKGYNLPTPIQRKAIPKIMSGANIVATARTGSGKTAAFLIPIIEQLKNHSQIVGARCVILSPTRELALQTEKFFRDLARNTDLRVGVIVGGASLEGQFETLAQNPDVIIATPGRFLHHLKETKYSLKQVKMVIYDEADRLFELGFADQIKEINAGMPQEKQSIMMSATMPKELQEFATTGIREYTFLGLDKESKIPEKLLLHFLITRSSEKYAALLYLLGKMIKSNELTIVFVSTKYHVQYLELLLQMCRLKATGIYGDMDPLARKLAFQKFSRKNCNILVVTDLAARGLDIPMLDNVVHFDFPSSPKIFIHRTGRTARAGKSGTCYALLTADELPYMFDISTHIGRKLIDEKINNEQVPISTEVAYYGNFPTNLLSEECEEISENLKNSGELEKLQSSAKNGYTKYLKMRTPASKHGSMKRREIIDNLKVHPLFKKTDESESKTENIEDILHEIHNFKAKKGSKMAFTNPYSDAIQHMADYSKIHKVQPENHPIEEHKKIEEIIEKPKEMDKKPEIVRIKKKRKMPEDYKDHEHFVSWEPTTSQEKLKQVFLFKCGKINSCGVVKNQ